MESSRKAYTVATVVVDSYDLETGEVMGVTIFARSGMTDHQPAVEQLESVIGELPPNWGSLNPTEIRDLQRRWDERRIVLWTQLELF